MTRPFNVGKSTLTRRASVPGRPVSTIRSLKRHWREWPPRLPDQPIFYPVLNEDYAVRIARDWNVKANGAGYVTKFEVEKTFLDQYEVQQVGGRTILEYWIPAEDLKEFNRHIVGLIEVVAEFS